MSVIVTELLLLLAVVRFLETVNAHPTTSVLAVAVVIGNAGLVLVDHIHFQYNGFLLGFLILTIDFLYRVRNNIISSDVIFINHQYCQLCLAKL
jgi:alpha-1,3-glucosyltransferase